MSDKEKQADLDAIREQGFQIMQYGNLPPNAKLIIHLWQYGLYKNYTVKAWSLYTKPDNRETTFARRYRWQRYGKKMVTIDGTNRPNIYIVDLIPDQKRLAKLIEQGKNIPIPIVGITPRMGLDGGFSGICIPSVSIPNCISWWAAPPDEWLPLKAWFYRMFSFLNRQKL
jgi:hypothetical protein